MTLQDAAKILIALRVALPSTVYAYLSMHNALRLEDFKEYLSIKSSLFYCTELELIQHIFKTAEKHDVYNETCLFLVLGQFERS